MIIKREVRKANIFFLVLLFVMLFGSLGVGVYLQITQTTLQGINASLITQLAFILVPSLAYMSLTKTKFSELGFSRNISMMNIGIVFFISIFLIPIMALISAASAYFFPNEISGYVGDISTSFFVTTIIIAVIPAFCEELAIRGVLLNAYVKGGVGIPLVLFINGLFFGLFHLDLQQFFYAFFAGVIFSYIVIVTGSVVYSIVSHFIINFVNIAMLFSIPDTATEATEAVETVSINTMLQLLLFSTISAFFLFRLFKILKRNNSDTKQCYNTPASGSVASQLLRSIDVFFIASLVFFAVLIILTSMNIL